MLSTHTAIIISSLYHTTGNDSIWDWCTGTEFISHYSTLRNPCVSQHLCTCLPLFLLGRAKNTQTTYEKWNKSNLVITSSKELNKLCCFKRVSLYVKCTLKVKEKYFKTKYRPASILRNVNIMIYLKFKLQLKYRNKTYSSITVNFHTTQYNNLKLKFMNNKGYHVKRPIHRDTVASLL